VSTRSRAAPAFLRAGKRHEREPESPVGIVDTPEDGTDIEGVFRVRGWLRHGAGYDRVELRLDGGEPQRARVLSHPRFDLVAGSDDPTIVMAGWDALLDVPPTATGSVRLVADAVGPAGRFELGRRWLVATRPDRPAPDPARLAVVRARADAVTSRHRPRAGGVHLLVVTHHLGLGGGQLYLQELMRHVLAAEDVSCLVLAVEDGPLRDELEGWGARVHVTGPIPRDGLAYEARMLELGCVALPSAANVVVANTTGAFWGVDLAERLGIPSVWAVHESFAVDHFEHVSYVEPPDAYVSARLRHALAGASAVVFEAEATRRLYEPDVGPGRAVRIDYGIDLQRIDRYRRDHDRAALRAAHGLAEDECLLVCIGTYEPRKSQASLATAFARVAGDHPDAVLALVGDTGSPYAIGVRDLVERLDLGDRVRLVPVTPDIDAWYLMADVFVLASDVESLPRSMLEAMAFGVPVLVTSVFGVPEVIADGHNGLLFDPLDLGSLAAALERVLRLSPDERQRVGAFGREHAETVRPSKYYADAYRRLCEVLIDDPAVLPADALAGP
jgi:D-inositol-3-phosphate glycosyltransferase